ncbi:DUF1349 domain-containing protein [Paenibacillus sp. PK3_47]|uniref:DUF1349 domain-containing protein n=1 Tax=Paenibacillus sp. PK3_47 TaxID=2072642 RepID=UPI00201E6579|nr:DUF1349 domain-containing protein [Paenibacillus sp. PK3_47]UQZ36581.1 DUF1349 domain-containing protein [Paenibacillus sp. PK3_47]
MEQKDFEEYEWLNKGDFRFEADKLILTAPAKTDYFCPGGSIGEEGVIPEGLANAPFFYTEIPGDFVLKVKVSHDFLETYDAAAIMVMKDLKVWAKACFELTDFDTKAVVSVVTNQISDDANGCNIDGNEVWLQVARYGNSFAFHYSLDGKKYDMMRYFSLPVEDTVKVGIVAQAPTGQGGDRVFQNLSVEKKTVKNLRTGA